MLEKVNIMNAEVEFHIRNNYPWSKLPHNVKQVRRIRKQRSLGEPRNPQLIYCWEHTVTKSRNVIRWYSVLHYRVLCTLLLLTKVIVRPNIMYRLRPGPAGTVL